MQHYYTGKKKEDENNVAKKDYGQPDCRWILLNAQTSHRHVCRRAKSHLPWTRRKRSKSHPCFLPRKRKASRSRLCPRFWKWWPHHLWPRRNHSSGPWYRPGQPVNDPNFSCVPGKLARSSHRNQITRTGRWFLWKFGFTAIGQPFIFEGTPHVTMRREAK